MTKHFEITEKIVSKCVCGGTIIKRKWEGITSFLSGSKTYCIKCKKLKGINEQRKT